MCVSAGRHRQLTNTARSEPNNMSPAVSVRDLIRLRNSIHSHQTTPQPEPDFGASLIKQARLLSHTNKLFVEVENTTSPQGGPFTSAGRETRSCTDATMASSAKVAAGDAPGQSPGLSSSVTASRRLSGSLTTNLTALTAPAVSRKSSPSSASKNSSTFAGQHATPPARILVSQANTPKYIDERTGLPRKTKPRSAQARKKKSTLEAEYREKIRRLRRVLTASCHLDLDRNATEADFLAASLQYYRNINNEVSRLERQLKELEHTASAPSWCLHLCPMACATVSLAEATYGVLICANQVSWDNEPTM